MSTAFLIRDGLETDIPACLELDHSYETDFVWQMSVEGEPGQQRITFKTQRLPRTLEAVYPANERRMHLALPSGHCFLVAVAKDDGHILGYLTMRSDPVYQSALIQDVVISRGFRRLRMGTRLLNIARQWAKEHDLNRLTLETQTKNFPSIAFCQGSGFHFCGYNDQYFPNQDIALFFSQSLR